MNIAGINLGKTKFSKSLKNGGTCLLVDNQIQLAISEERITRIKYDAGFTNSLNSCLLEQNLGINDLDLVVISSCCEKIRTPNTIGNSFSARNNELLFVNHHLSHAYSAFFLSPFEKSLIVVADGGGNTIQNDSPNWWKLSREQNSYYIGEGEKITLIGRDFEEPYAAGLGELYRYVSHCLGWRTTDAGKVMSLAALGDPQKFKNIQLVKYNNSTGRLSSQIRNEPFNDDTFISFFRENGFTNIHNRKPDEDLSQDFIDLAWFVQDQVSKAIIKKVTYLSTKTGIKKMCFAGGVALNCVINERIIRETPIDEIFIQPAAGDHGQCIGNVLFGVVQKHSIDQKRGYFSPYLGLTHDWDKEVPEAARKHSVPSIRFENSGKMVDTVAQQIASGLIIGWVQGRSEIGPRALGNRSIFADPRYIISKEKLNSIKKREKFMPIAPCVLEEYLTIFFDSTIPSPYMLRAVPVKPIANDNIPAVIHYDKTARIQTVNKSQNELLYQLLHAFLKLTGIPVLCNTSFNAHKEPIVENADEAINTYKNIGLDTLIVGNWIIGP